jgi:solute:Na+ symporter, SSS family
VIALTLPLAAATLASADLLIVAASVAVLLLISWYFGREEKDTNDFFLGGRRVPPAAASLSFVATEISALTIVSFPAMAYKENWWWLQFFLGQIIARILVAHLFIPVYYRTQCTSIYEYLRSRFGPGTQYAGSAFFFVTRLLGSGIRLYAACMAVAMILGWKLEASLFLFTAVSIVFIAFGGIKAVVWAGAYQAIFFLSAAVALIVYLVIHISGGLTSALDIARQADKIRIFNLGPDLGDPTTLWTGLVNGMFVAMANFGADQEMVQRLLTVRSTKASQRTLLSTIGTVLPAYWMYLIIGTLLYVFYRQNPTIPQPRDTEMVLSHFVITVLPIGFKGVILSAIILASIDSPLSSLTNSFVTDLYRPLIRRGASERHYLMISRIGVILFGLILAMIAYGCRKQDHLVRLAFELIGVTACALLGVFLFGLLTHRRANLGNIIAMFLGTGTTIALWVVINRGYLHLAKTWLILIGTVITFAVAFVLSSKPPKAPIPDCENR